MANHPSGWWKYPFKPVRVRESIFETIRPEAYVMEKKYDGWRALAIAGPGGVTLWTREKTRIEVPDNLRDQLEAFGMPEGTVLDGEIWNPTKRGSWRHARGVRCMLTFWDAIRSGQRDLSGLTLEERRAEMEAVMRGGSDDVRIVQWLPATAEAYREVRMEAESFREASNARSGFVHGAVLKRRGSPRRDHVVRCVEHADWLKIVIDGMQSGA